MKRALYLTPKLPYPPQDGGRIVSWNLARGLRHAGYEVDLVSFVRDEGLLEAHGDALGEVFRSITTETKDVHRQYPVDLALAFATRSSYFVRKYGSRALLSRLEERLSSESYDLAVIESAYMGVYAPALRRRRDRVRHVMLRLQNVEHEIFERLARYESRRPFRYLLEREAKHFRRFERSLFQSIDDVRAITERDANNAEALCGRPVGVLDAHIDCDAYTPGVADEIEPRSVVCIGDLAWLPNRNGVLWFHREIWPAVLERFPDARSYIVGKNPPASVRELDCEHTVVTGYVEDDAEYFRRAHLFVVPLLEGSGVRIKILMALAMGRSVLSTPVGAEGISYEGLSRAEEPADWIERITEAFGTPPAIDDDAVAYARARHHWRRPLDLTEAGSS